jgi:2-methylcitrate dehydratase
MIDHAARAYPARAALPREEQLARKLAAVATDPVEVPAEVTGMVEAYNAFDTGIYNFRV